MLQWSSSHPTGEALTYNVWFARADREIFLSNHLLSVNQDGTGFAVQNLPFGTVCSWKIEAVDETGDLVASPVFHFSTAADASAPTGTVVINGGVSSTDFLGVTLSLTAFDSGSGVRWMRVSNDGVHWTGWEFFTDSLAWNLADASYGGQPGLTTYYVYVQFMDFERNESGTYTDSIQKTSGGGGYIVLNGDYYPTIQEAINAASYGDTVFLSEGVFDVRDSRNATLDAYGGISMKAGVTLQGAGADKTTVDYVVSFGSFFVADADDSVIQGLTITNSGGTVEGVVVSSDSSIIRHCVITGMGRTGIRLGWGELVSTGALIANNVIHSNDYGMFIVGSSGSRIYNNTIIQNNVNGITSYESGADFANNIIAYNGNYGVEVASGATFRNNDVYGNTARNYEDGGSRLNDQTGLNGNIFVNPSLTASHTLNGGSPCIGAGANMGLPASGAPDIGAFEYGGTGTLQVISNRSDAEYHIVGAQSYDGSGGNWSVSGVPIGTYSVYFSPITNYNNPPFDVRILESSQTVVFDGGYTTDLEPPDVWIQVDYGMPFTADRLVDISLVAEDKVAGLDGAMMQFSNDGASWTTPEPYTSLKRDWDLTAYGGSSLSGVRTIYAKVADSLGNYGDPVTDDVLYVPNRATLRVPEEFVSIQAAVDAAQDGDMVWVAPGEYSESVTVNRAIRLQGAGPGRTVITNDRPIETSHADCVVDGFTLRGFIGLIVVAGAPVISNNVLDECFRGMDIYDGGDPIVRNNLFVDCGGGVYVSNAGGDTLPIFENNTIVGCDTGISNALAEPGDLTILRNNVIANCGVAVSNGNTSDVVHVHVQSSFNTYWANSVTFDGSYVGGISSSNDRSDDPRFVDAASGDYSL
jgi:parallel beta-helix repeat protein